MRDTFYNFSRNNRNNTTKKISIGITENSSKPRELLRDLVDPSTGVIFRRGTISIPTNERVFDDKCHHSIIFTLYRRSGIGKLWDKLTESLIQNREENMARLEDASNHKLEFINNIYINFMK